MHIPFRTTAPAPADQMMSGRAAASICALALLASCATTQPKAGKDRPSSLQYLAYAINEDTGQSEPVKMSAWPTAASTSGRAADFYTESYGAISCSKIGQGGLLEDCKVEEVVPDARDERAFYVSAVRQFRVDTDWLKTHSVDRHGIDVFFNSTWKNGRVPEISPCMSPFCNVTPAPPPPPPRP